MKTCIIRDLFVLGVRDVFVDLDGPGRVPGGEGRQQVRRHCALLCPRNNDIAFISIMDGLIRGAYPPPLS